MTVVICEGQQTEVSATPGAELWLHRDEVEAASGWHLKPEGFCKEEICVPLPQDGDADYVRGEQVNVSALWAMIGKPAVASEAGDVWFLGEAAEIRNDALQSLKAPDFTLPDFDGNLQSLSNYRRMRVLLLTWASW